MNEFFIASNETQSMEIDSDYSIEVRQLLVKEIVVAERFAGPIRNSLKQDWGIEDLYSVINKHQIASLLLVTFFTTLSADNAKKIKDSNPEKYIEIFECLLRVNEDYFKKIEGKTSDKNSSWFDSFQYLVKHGHKHNEILNYSFGAFMAYIKSAQKLESASLLNTGNTIRIAYHADKKGFEKFTKDMKS